MECLAPWETFLHDDTLPPLVHAALAHSQFEAIHPFLDGNGRVGRLLITLLLVDKGVLPSPLLYLSAWFEATRPEYYARLFAASGVPYTILRATQFHELLGFILRGAERLPLAPLPLDFRSFAYWNPQTAGWQVAPGCYRVLVGRSSRDLPLAATLAVGSASCPGAAASLPVVASGPASCLSVRSILIHLLGVLGSASIPRLTA